MKIEKQNEGEVGFKVQAGQKQKELIEMNGKIMGAAFGRPAKGAAAPLRP